MAAVSDKPRYTARHLATKALREAGVTVNRVERIFPPLDTGGEVEVWFVGHEKGEKASRQLTAYVIDCEGAEVVVSEGW